jgi:hypothetical protein
MESINGSGIIGMLQVNSSAIPFDIFPALIIILIWSIISFGSFYAVSRRYGQGDFLVSLNVGGFIASIIAGILLIFPNFIQLRTVVVTLLLELLFFIMLITDKNTKND